MRSAEKTARPAGGSVLHHTDPANLVRARAEHRGVLAASFILLVAQQDLLKLTTTRQTSGDKPVLPSVLMPFLIFAFAVIMITLIITQYRSLSVASAPLRCLHSGAKHLVMMMMSFSVESATFGSLSLEEASSWQWSV